MNEQQIRERARRVARNIVQEIKERARQVALECWRNKTANQPIEMFGQIIAAAMTEAAQDEANKWRDAISLSVNQGGIVGLQEWANRRMREFREKRSDE